MDIARNDEKSVGLPVVDGRSRSKGELMLKSNRYFVLEVLVEAGEETIVSVRMSSHLDVDGLREYPWSQETHTVPLVQSKHPASTHDISK